MEQTNVEMSKKEFENTKGEDRNHSTKRQTTPRGTDYCWDAVWSLTNDVGINITNSMFLGWLNVQVVSLSYLPKNRCSLKI